MCQSHGQLFMQIINKEESKVFLENLLERNTDIKSAVISTSDGIIVLGVNMNDKSNRLGAMAAASLGLGKQVITTVCDGSLNEIMITGNKGQVFIYSISNKAVLVLTTKEQPNVAMVNWEAHKTINQLSSVK